jgi:Glycosyl transferases group 1.
LSKSNNLFYKFFYSFEYCRIKKFELNNLKKFDFIYTLNNKDLEILKKYKINNISVKYPQVEDWIYNVKRNKVQNKTILFLGAMHRNENQQAVKWFVSNIIPTLISFYPNLKFYVVGGGVSESIKKLQNKNVVITGYVENLEYFFEKAQVAVVPLSYGAGIKIKTVETISAKIPTIATKIGAEGVDKNKFLKIANSKEDFVSLIKKEFNNV